MNIKLDYSNAFVKKHEIDNMAGFIKESHNLLHEKKGAGSDYLGWIDLPSNIDKEVLHRINNVAIKIQRSSDAFIVIGIGGSYLGARACIEGLSHTYYNEISIEKRKTPKGYYVGQNISSKYILDLFDVIEDKDISINVISKSGTTTESAIAFRLFKEYIEKKYGKEEAKERIIVTTDKEKGALRKLADIEGYESFIIPDDIGGRYSVLTPVGLLPIAVAGIDIYKLLEGSNSGLEEYSNNDIYLNPSYQYAAVRNILYSKGKKIEILVNYEPALMYLSEWWKQLYGESEGKDGKGIFPTSVDFTTDLHSMGQYIQDGVRNLFETTINVEKSEKEIILKTSEENLDGLNYLAGNSLDFVNKKAFEGTLKAHVSGNVPNIIITIPELNEYYFGKLIYFFEKACAISGYLLGVNPFNQPGVEEYKKNTFQLLGKHGY